MRKTANNKIIPNIDHVFFLDFDIPAMNLKKNYKTIIARIVERGGQEEID
ncbi:DUF6922 domain-containing protein [Chryseobacterium sp. Alg-005]